jgi:two-component system, sensor histidine kinase
MHFQPGDRVHAERLRLVLDGLAQSLPVGVFLALLLTWTLYQPVIGKAVLGWLAAFCVSRISLVLYARRARMLDLSAQRMRDIFRWLIVAKAIEGVLWGLLVWIAFDTATLPGKLLLISLMAAISGNAVSLLAPVLRLYLALTIPMLLVVASKLGSMGDATHFALALCCVLYIAGQFGQARLSARTIHSAISLRFENLELIEKLRVESELARQATLEAEDANLSKSKFLAAASHDLRQPIHAQGLFLAALSKSTLDAKQKAIVKHAQAASEASTEMLNTLLDFSRIEAGVVTPKPVLTPLQQLFHKLERELAPLADGKGLVYRVRDTPLVIHTDAALLELVLRNLITNAIRYTERGGLLVGCRVQKEMLTIGVYDTGIGIAPSQQAEVFKEFHQLGNPERDRRKGLGLGLAIAEGLCASLGYMLGLSSTPGRGSAFTVALPRTAVIHSAELGPIEEAAHPVEQAALDLTVLVIDDDETIRLGMQSLLTAWGCLGLSAESLEDALALCAHTRPHAIVCDYRLRNGLTGSTVIQALRSQLGLEVPCVLITGDTAPERIREAAQSGVPILHKPVRPDELLHFLSDLRP